MAYLWTDSVSLWSLWYSYTPRSVDHMIQLHTQGSISVRTILHSGTGHSVYRWCLMYTLDTGHHGCLVHTLEKTLNFSYMYVLIFYIFLLYKKILQPCWIIVPLSLKSHKFKDSMSVLCTIMISPWTAGLQATFIEYVEDGNVRCIEAQKGRPELSL